MRITSIQVWIYNQPPDLQTDPGDGEVESCIPELQLVTAFS